MASHVIVGIDPGKEGALARLDAEFPGQAELIDTPLLKGPGRESYDEVEMARALRRLIAPTPGRFGVLVVLEKVHAMPKQGVSTTFTFGAGWGIWRGIIAALEVPSVLVDPRTWGKVSLRDVPKVKDNPKAAAAETAAAASRLYPQAASALRTPRGRVLEGRVDALLIAHWARVSGL